MNIFTAQPELRKIIEDKISDTLSRSSSVSSMDVSLILTVVELVLVEHLKVPAVSAALQPLIDRVSSDLNDFKHPGAYQESEYYERCSARADYAEDVLGYLRSAQSDCAGPNAG